jgi:hypothetical protein
VESEIKTLLDKLADIRSQLDVLRLDKEDAINQVLTPEIRKAISDIEIEFGEKAEAATTNASELEAALKSMMINHGASVKGQRLQAVYVSPKVTWDAKALDGYAMAHPKLFAFRKEGEPSVQIRVVK